MKVSRNILRCTRLVIHPVLHIERTTSDLYRAAANENNAEAEKAYVAYRYRCVPISTDAVRDTQREAHTQVRCFDYTAGISVG
jgi:hypothetical protein